MSQLVHDGYIATHYIPRIITFTAQTDMTPEGVTTNGRFLKLHIYNTFKKAERELLSLEDYSGPDALLQSFIHTLRQCHRLNYFVGTAVYTPAAGHVYLASDNENWAEMVCANGNEPPSDPVNIISGSPLYPEGRFIDLNVYNNTGGAVYRFTLPRDSSAAHARLLRHFIEALVYCNGEQFAIQNTVYTDDDASIIISTVDATWAQGLDEALRGLP